MDGHGDKESLSEAVEMLEQGLDTMNQETIREANHTKLWRRISMINTPNRRTDNQIDLLGTTTWGVRKVSFQRKINTHRLKLNYTFARLHGEFLTQFRHS